MRLGSKHSIHETIEKIEAAAKDVRLSVEKMNSSKVTNLFPHSGWNLILNRKMPTNY